MNSRTRYVLASLAAVSLMGLFWLRSDFDTFRTKEIVVGRTQMPVPPGHGPIPLTPTPPNQDGSLVESAVAIPVVSPSVIARSGEPLTGMVVDQSGRPIAGAEVAAEIYEPYLQISALTAHDGTFGLVAPRPSNEVRLRARKGNLASRALGPLALHPGGLHELTLRLETTSGIRGRVVDRAGHPQSGIQVLASTAEGEDPSLIAKSDGVGEFAMEGLLPRNYQLRIAQMGHVFDTTRIDAEVHVTEGAISDIILTLDIGHASITGNVFDKSRRPIAGAKVVCQEQTSQRQAYAVSGVDGAYFLKNLEEGRYELSVAHRGWNTASHEPISAGNINVDFILEKLSSLQGMVVDARTGTPVQAFGIALVHGGEQEFKPSMNPLLQAVHHEQGEFRLENVETGFAALAVRAPGFDPVLYPVRSFAPGEAVSGIRIPLSEGRMITGRVVDGARTALGGVMIFEGVFPAEDRRAEWVAAQTSEDGTFTLDPLLPGTRELIAYAPGYPTTTQPLSLDRSEYVEITLVKGGVLEGTVRLGDDPAVAQEVRLSYPNSETLADRKTRTGADGRYLFDGLEEGEISVTAMLELNSEEANSSRKRSHELRSSVTSANPLVLDFVFPLLETALEGYVRRDNRPVQAFVSAAWFSEEGALENITVQSDETGHYRLDPIPSGQITLDATVQSETNSYSEYALVNWRGETVVPEGQATRYDIDISSGGSIVGQVLGMETEEFGYIEITRDTNVDPRAASHNRLNVVGRMPIAGTDRTFNAMGLQTDTYALRARVFRRQSNADSIAPPLERSASVEVQVTEGHEAVVEIALP